MEHSDRFEIGGIDRSMWLVRMENVICCSVLVALYPLSDDGCSITGEPVRIYKEWEIPEEWDIEGVSMEGLNVKKVGEYYYLFAAEGGTAGPPTSHMVVQARSKNIMGPWENAPFNPLLRTESRNENGGVKGMALLLIRKMDGYL